MVLAATAGCLGSSSETGFSASDSDADLVSLELCFEAVSSLALVTVAFRSSGLAIADLVWLS